MVKFILYSDVGKTRRIAEKFVNKTSDYGYATTVEISVLILSCVILGLNPVLPVLLFIFFIS